jgi:hypothetical protein
MLNNNEEIMLGYEKYLKIKKRTNECSKKWIREHPENAKKNNKTYYNKIKEEQPERYKEMLKKKVEQKKAREGKNIELVEKVNEEELHPALQNLYF